ncbi:uncharacterized protein PAF06_014052 [Gastrophryne carolinensis]
MNIEEDIQHHQITAALRIRPFSQLEMERGVQCITHKLGEQILLLKDPSGESKDFLQAKRSRDRTFVFDAVFDQEATQEQVYRSTVKNLVEGILHGYNATVFAYGPTGTGKTYTMLGMDCESGIFIQMLDDLFQAIQDMKTMEYSVSLSFLEIYNETMRDLLNPSGVLELRDDSKGNVKIAGITEFFPSNSEEAVALVKKGNKHRTQEPTAANKASSRSHAILQVIVKQSSKATSPQEEAQTAKLFLIDLAGSERASQTQNRSKRIKEGAHINLSLLALGNCITALSDRGRHPHVNYRDSKLTRLLKDALSGNSRTVIIAHVSPSIFAYEETRTTLIYASRAKNIKTTVRRNYESAAHHVTKYSRAIYNLHRELQRLHKRIKEHGQEIKGLKHIGKRIINPQEVVHQADNLNIQEEPTALKIQLQHVIEEHMKVRRSLLQLDNAQLEMHVEAVRHLSTITDWEQSKARSDTHQREEKAAENTAMDEGDDEEDEALVDNIDLPEPQEVMAAREEVNMLLSEQKKTAALMRDLDLDLRSVLLPLPTKADLESIPTKADMETMILRIEKAFWKDLEVVQHNVAAVEDRVAALENARVATEDRLTHLEQTNDLQATQISNLKIQNDDLENRSRRNNLRIRGLPELPQYADLEAIVTSVFYRLLGNTLTAIIKLDRIHRAAGRPPGAPDAPRDILCRVHHYRVKEEILRKAWEAGQIVHDSSPLTVLPDLARSTLWMRRQLKPLLQKIKESGAAYRWGYPFHLIVRKNGGSFTLRTPGDLDGLFVFLDSSPLEAALKEQWAKTKMKTSQLEQQMSQQFSSDHTELFRLLHRVHELQICNTELLAKSICKENILYQKDFVILSYQHYRSLCQKIIQLQQTFIDEKVHNQEQLENLSHLGSHEAEQRRMRQMELLNELLSSRLEDDIFHNGTEAEKYWGAHLHLDIEQNDTSVADSRKSTANHTRLTLSSTSSDLDSGYRTPKSTPGLKPPRQPSSSSLLTPFHHLRVPTQNGKHEISNDPSIEGTPTRLFTHPLEDNGKHTLAVLKLSSDELEEIAAGTRSISLVAARRRSKVYEIDSPYILKERSGPSPLPPLQTNEYLPITGFHAHVTRVRKAVSSENLPAIILRKDEAKSAIGSSSSRKDGRQKTYWDKRSHSFEAPTSQVQKKLQLAGPHWHCLKISKTAQGQLKESSKCDKKRRLLLGWGKYRYSSIP